MPEQISKNIMRELEAELFRIISNFGAVADVQSGQIKSFLMEVAPTIDQQVAAALAGDKVAAFNLEYLRGTIQAMIANNVLDFMQKEKEQMVTATMCLLKGAMLAISSV